MTQTISGLTWQETASVDTLFARVDCAFATDTTWRITPTGVNFSGKTVNPRFVRIINQGNASQVSVTFGTYPVFVPPYQTKTYQLPLGTREVTVVVGAGTVPVFFFASQSLVDDVVDQYGISFDAGLAIVYTTVTKTAAPNNAQLITDGNKHVDFIPPGSDQNYNLLGIGANPVPDGYLSFIKHRGGANVVSLVPNGADVINGIWTSGSPLKLSAGDGGKLRSDGSAWEFSGKISWASNALVIAGTTTDQTLTHNMGIVPSAIRVWLENVIAENGYNPGDTYEFTPLAFQYGAPLVMNGLALRANANTLLYRHSAAFFPITRQSDGNTNININAANWRLRFRLERSI